MTDGTFSLRPLLKRDDYEYLSRLARKSEVATFVSLDGHASSEAKSYYLEILKSDKLLLMLFHRLNDPRIVYAFKPAGKDWRFLLGRIYPQDFDDLRDVFI